MIPTYQLLNELLSDEEISKCDMCVYYEVMLLENNGYCSATTQHIADFIGYSNSSVRHSISKLINLGYLERIENDNPKYGKTRGTLTVNVSEESMSVRELRRKKMKAFMQRKPLSDDLNSMLEVSKVVEKKAEDNAKKKLEKGAEKVIRDLAFTGIAKEKLMNWVKVCSEAGTLDSVSHIKNALRQLRNYNADYMLKAIDSAIAMKSIGFYVNEDVQVQEVVVNPDDIEKFREEQRKKFGGEI